VQDRTKVTMTD